mmetsp:Transcript_14220/g.43647  ORF Transcript_14220/g.43647 Transcript_14220/m.43647 type:complete len:216 (+) Transcript_14220:203-850(+)
MDHKTAQHKTPDTLSRRIEMGEPAVRLAVQRSQPWDVDASGKISAGSAAAIGNSEGTPRRLRWGCRERARHVHGSSESRGGATAIYEMPSNACGGERVRTTARPCGSPSWPNSVRPISGAPTPGSRAAVCTRRLRGNRFSLLRQNISELGCRSSARSLHGGLGRQLRVARRVDGGRERLGRLIVPRAHQLVPSAACAALFVSHGRVVGLHPELRG